MAKALKIAAIVVGVAAVVLTAGTALLGAPLIAGALGVTVGTLGTITAALGVAAKVLNVAAGLMAPKPKFGEIGGSGSQLDFSADPTSGQPYVMGSARVGEAVVHEASWGVKNKFLGLVGVLSCAGPIMAYDGLFADNTAVSFAGGNAVGYYHDFMLLRTQLGARPEAAALTMTAPDGSAMPDWGTASKLSGLAATGLVLVADVDKGKVYSGGLPQLTHQVRGVLAYDPRLDGTNGGSGAQRPGGASQAETSYAYSENPWVHHGTFALGRWVNGVRVIGPGLPAESIDWASHIEAANIADANGWTISGRAMSTDNKWDVLRSIAQAGGGYPIPTQAKLACLVNVPRVSLETIKEEHIKGPVSVSQMTMRRDRLNGAIPRYRDPSLGWQVVSGAAVRNADYLAADGGKTKTREIDLPFVADKDQAAQLVAYEVANSRERSPIQVELDLYWAQYKTGDCLTLDLPSALLFNQKCVVIGREVDPDSNTVRFTFRTEDDAKHAWAMGVGGGVPITTVGNTPGVGDTSSNSINARNGDPIVAPTLPPVGAVEHTLNRDGSANVSFEWLWPGSEASIDGFLVKIVRQNSDTLGGNTEAPLGQLTLSDSSWVVGYPQTGTINGTTAGSTIEGSGLPAGFTIDGPNRTWAWDGTGTVSSGAMTLTETLTGRPNSPKPSNIYFSIAATSGGPSAGSGPVLNNPFAAGNLSATEGNSHVETDTPNGTIWAYFSPNIIAPDIETLKASAQASKNVDTVGIQHLNAIGLSPPNGTFWTHFYQENLSGGGSNVVTSGSFTAGVEGGSGAGDTGGTPTLNQVGSVATSSSTIVTNMGGSVRNGWLYSIATDSLTPPSKAVIEATGNRQDLPSNTNDEAQSFTGLTPNTQYFLHYFQRTLDGRESAIFTATATTLALGAPTYKYIYEHTTIGHPYSQAWTTEADPTVFASISDLPDATQSIYTGSFFDTTCWMYLVNWTDGSPPMRIAVEAVAGMGTRASAKVEYAQKVAEALGRLPKIFRNSIKNDGVNHSIGFSYRGGVGVTASVSGGRIYFSKYRFDCRIVTGHMEEMLFHECGHTIQSAHYNTTAWQSALTADGKRATNRGFGGENENWAEMCVIAYMMKYKPERIPAAERAIIQQQVPNQLAYIQNNVFTVP